MDNVNPLKDDADLTIIVKAGRNWKNQRGEPLQASLLRCEYGEGNIIGESSKVLADPDGNVELEFTATLTVEQELTAWNQMANTPLVLLLMESSQKDAKKKKSPSFTKMGVITIDLLPLLFQPPQASEQWLTFYPVDHLMSEPERHLLKAPEVSVLFQSTGPLIPQNVLNEMNMLTITLDAYYGLPVRLQESWDCYDYITALFVPIDQTDQVLSFDKALCQEASPEWERRHWYGRTGGMAEEDFIPNLNRQTIADDCAADFRGDDVNFELMGSDRPRVTINTEKRFLLTRKMLSAFENYVSRNKVLPVELLIKKSRQAAAIKARRKNAEDLVSTQLGMVTANLGYLLYPGVSRVRGAYRVRTLDPAEYEQVTGGRRSLLLQTLGGGAGGGHEEPGSVVDGKTSVLDRAEKGKKGKDESKDGEKGKKSADQPILPLSVNLNSVGELTAQTGDDVFACGNMYLVMDIRLKTPLVKRHTLQELAVSVQSLIPQREELPGEARSAAQAEERYHKTIRELGRSLLDELRQNKQKYTANEGGDTADAEDIWQQFAFDMNTSGKYFIIKEALKPPIIDLVREKYLKYTSFINKEEVQDFISQLYVYLVTEMHAALNQFLDSEEDPLVAPSVVDCDALRDFAEVAQRIGNPKKAQQFYLERIARERQNADFWCEYGEFCLSVGNVDVAESCFKEVLSHNPRSARGLLMLGICSSQRPEPNHASLCLEYAATVRRECFITQTVLGIHLERADDAVGAEIAYKSALRLLARAIRYHQVEVQMEYYDSYLMELDCCPVPAEPTPLELQVAAAEQQAQLSAEQSAEPERDLLPVNQEESKLEQDDSEKKRRRTNRRISRSVSSRPGGRHKSADKSDGKTEEKRTSPRAADGAQEDTESVIAAKANLTSSRVLVNKLFLLVSQFLMRHKAYTFSEHAASKMLVTGTEQLSAEYYNIAARVNFLMGDLSAANDIVHEAQKYYYRDPKLWSLMGHIYYWSGDTEAAQRCYVTLLDMGDQPDDIHIVHMFLGEIYYRAEQYKQARGSFLLAVRARPTPFSWLWLGKACYRLGHHGEAEEALREANVLDTLCGETWAYLSLVSLLSEQRVLAEQAYKYAIQLGGIGKELLDEIHQLQKEKGFGDPGFQSSWWSKQYEPTQ